MVSGQRSSAARCNDGRQLRLRAPAPPDPVAEPAPDADGKPDLQGFYESRRRRREPGTGKTRRRTGTPAGRGV